MKHPLDGEVLALEKGAEQLLDAGRKKGATHAEVYATYLRSSRIALEKQDFHLASSDDGFSLGLRVVIANKQGFAACNTLLSEDLKHTAAKAVEIAKFSPANPYFSINRTEHIPQSAPTETLWDNALSDLSFKTQMEWSRLFFQQATQDPRFRLNEGSLLVGCGANLCLNTHGTHQLETATGCDWSLMGMAIEGSNITSFDYFSRHVARAEQVPKAMMESIRNFRNATIRALNHGPAKSYLGLVAFSPRAVLDILVSNIGYHLDGRNVLDGTSRWKTSNLGTQVLPKELSLTDNPWLIDRVSASFFDREGNPTSNRTLISKGNLEGWLLDNYAAAGLGLKSTGNAVGSPVTPPSVGAHCLCLEPGTTPWKILCRDAAARQSEMLLINRFSGQTDPVTGDFSGVAKGAEWYKSGEHAYFVRETLISGNLFGLMNELFGLSQEIEIIDSNEHSPYAIFGGISVTATQAQKN